MIGITVNSDRAMRKFDAVERRHVPFATSLALNVTAHAIVEDTEPELQRVFDQPTRFTAKAFRFQRSTKRRLVTTVQRKTAQSKRHFLEVQSKGGARGQKGLERKLSPRLRSRTVLPASGARKTGAGNWSPAQRRRVLAARPGDGGKVFAVGPGQSHLSPGFYERRARGKLKKIAHLSNAAPRYADRLDLRPLALKRVRRDFERNFRRAMRRAVGG